MNEETFQELGKCCGRLKAYIYNYESALQNIVLTYSLNDYIALRNAIANISIAADKAENLSYRLIYQKTTDEEGE